MFSPITTQELEDSVFNLVTSETKCKCTRLRIKDRLFIEPEDDDLIEKLMNSGLSTSELCVKHDLKIAYDANDIKCFKKQYSYPFAEEKEVEEKKVEMEEEGEETFDSKVMRALQETPFSARAAAPKEFFIGYGNCKTCLPIFVLYLFVVLLTKTAINLF